MPSDLGLACIGLSTKNKTERQVQKEGGGGGG